MKEGVSVASPACHREPTSRRPVYLLHAGLDLSRKKLDVCLLSDQGSIWTSSSYRPTSTRLEGSLTASRKFTVSRSAR
jgi:hypothetical protein